MEAQDWKQKKWITSHFGFMLVEWFLFVCFILVFWRPFSVDRVIFKRLTHNWNEAREISSLFLLLLAELKPRASIEELDLRRELDCILLALDRQ